VTSGAPFICFQFPFHVSRRPHHHLPFRIHDPLRNRLLMQRTVKEGKEVVARGYVVKSPLIAP
jgi:hypothetical protein